MRIVRLLLGIGLIISIASCSSSKNTTKTNAYHNITVPAGSTTAVFIPAKKGEMSEIEIQKWPHADLMTDSIPGMSLAKAYQFVDNKKATTIIVGVIDSGIDINHEDLKDNIWVNSDEIANNGKDDDKNGYIDDIHGWNFLGGRAEATPEQFEVTRLYKRLNPKYANKSEAQITSKDKEEYIYYLKVKKDFEKGRKEAIKNYELYKNAKKLIVDADTEAIKKLNKQVYTLEDLKTLNSADVAPLIRVLTTGATVAESKDQLDAILEVFGPQVNQYYNLDFNGRTTGDDAYNIKDVPYGNQYLTGSLTDEGHGTHVSGIALATRNNGKGMNGVANNVKLLAVRTVPGGDEHDKDIALAIRYAVDNGAKVINMSFGKGYSPNKEWVYEAFKYAASKDVLLVKAAGNDGKNIDKNDNFPTDADDKVNEYVDNVITVGAITPQFDENLVSSFSNYGKLNVDIFAPGTAIYSTVPKSKYESIQGTSMASPEVAGVAALVRSYYPQLSASQVKHVLMNSGIKVNFDVILPKSEGKKVPFSDLSVSGRVLNAYNALKMADQMVNSK